MSGQKVAWLEPDSMLDSDFLRQLFNFHNFDTLSFDKFCETLRDAGHDEVQDALQPFLKQLQPVRGLDAKPAKKVKHKARALLLRKSDVKSLVDVFGQQFKSRKAIRNFIQQAEPQEVAAALSTAASCSLAKELPNEVQIILRNRASLISTRTGLRPGPMANPPEDTDSVEPTASINQEETQMLPPSIDFLQDFDPQQIIQTYSTAVNQFPPPQRAPKKRGRPRKLAVVQPATADAREAYPSPSSPGLSLPLPVGFITAPAGKTPGGTKPITSGAETKPTNTSKKRKHTAAMGLDGQADLYDIPISSPSSRASDAVHAQTLPERNSTSVPSKKTKKARDTPAAKSSKSQKAMTEAEELLLKESLGIIPITPIGSQGTRGTVKDTRSESRQSTPKSMQSFSSAEDALLRECLKSTTRKTEDDLLRACLKLTSRTSSEKSQMPPQQTARSRREFEKSQKAHDDLTSTLVGHSDTTEDASKKKSKDKSSVATISRVAESTEFSSQITSLFKQSESKETHNNPASASFAPPGKARRSSQATKHSTSNTKSLQRMSSPELSFTPPAKDLLKRKRKSLEQNVDLEEGDTLEVDESVYDSEGNRMERSPTVKVTTKKKKKREKEKTAEHGNTSNQPTLSSGIALPVPKAKIKKHKNEHVAKAQPTAEGDEGVESTNNNPQSPDMAAAGEKTREQLDAGGNDNGLEAGNIFQNIANTVLLESTPISPQPQMPKIKLEPPSDRTSSSPSSTPRRPRSAPVTPRKQTGLSSPFFTPSSSKKSRSSPGTISSIEAPPLSHNVFGLIQEELANDPFKLLVAVIYLNRTRATIAIPKFRTLVEHYATANDVAQANVNDIADFIQPLGLHNQRASTIVNLANVWTSKPPVLGWRVRTPGYPTAEASRDIKTNEVLSDDDPREGAFEIGHISGLGAYAWDSWRIFCRDKLRGLAQSWNGEGAGSSDFEPEWKRVLPKDKELRAFLRWMWLKEGWKWDPLTGEKEVASEELMRKGQAGGLKWNEDGF